MAIPLFGASRMTRRSFFARRRELLGPFFSRRRHSGAELDQVDDDRADGEDQESKSPASGDVAKNPDCAPGYESKHEAADEDDDGFAPEPQQAALEGQPFPGGERFIGRSPAPDYCRDGCEDDEDDVDRKLLEKRRLSGFRLEAERKVDMGESALNLSERRGKRVVGEPGRRSNYDDRSAQQRLKVDGGCAPGACKEETGFDPAVSNLIGTGTGLLLDIVADCPVDRQPLRFSKVACGVARARNLDRPLHRRLSGDEFHRGPELRTVERTRALYQPVRAEVEDRMDETDR
jgi:hypothetical protein